MCCTGCLSCPATTHLRGENACFHLGLSCIYCWWRSLNVRCCSFLLTVAPEATARYRQAQATFTEQGPAPAFASWTRQCLPRRMRTYRRCASQSVRAPDKQAARKCMNPFRPVHTSLPAHCSITHKIYWFAATIFLVGHLPPPGSTVAATDARPFGSTIKNRADCTPLLAVNPLFTSCCNGAAART